MSNLLTRILPVGLLIGGGIYAAKHYNLVDRFFSGQEEQSFEGAVVRRGDLLISEVVRGNLSAKESEEVVVDIDGEAKIKMLTEEGKLLKKGDVVAELDVSEFEERKNRQEIEVKNAEASVIKAGEQKDIQEIQNQSDLAAAELDLRLAKLDLEKYTIEGGEWTNELAAAQESILIKEENLSRAKKDLEWTVKLHDEGFVQRQQLETDQLAVQRAEIELGQSKRDLELKRSYGHQRRKAELEANVGTRERNVEKVRKQASARMTDLDAELERAQYRLEREKKDLNRYIEQLKNGVITSPEDGYFVLQRTWRGRSHKEGDDVWGGTTLGSIPKSDTMVVDAAIHETKLKKIKEGMPCQITTDAFPGRVVPGNVSFVAIMASEQNWRRGGNEKMYKATIEMEGAPEGFRPGMSCNAEIIVENLNDVLFIPRQCVFYDGGETIVFVPGSKEAERRKVKVGLDNNSWVQILEGVTEGETVLLAPPANFKPKDAPAAKTKEGQPEAAGGGKPANAGSAGRPKSSSGNKSGSGNRGKGGQRGSGGRGGKPVE